MFIVYGTSSYGKVAQCGESHVATRFFHIFWIPLIPIQSHLLFSEGRGIKVGLHAHSVLAAYGRVWGILVPAIAVLVGLATLSAAKTPLEAVGTFAVFLVPILAAIFGAAASWLWLGRLSPDQRAQRSSYARFVGHPVDVALLGELRAGYRERLYEEVVRKGKMLAPSSYREGSHAESQWAEIAAHPLVADVEFLDAALTLARLDWSFAQGPERARLARAHEAIWRRIQTVLRERKPPAEAIAKV